ncbi:MAG: cysteine peptidase family C39 domain-containing protein [Patescibacteria group bacterium]
MLNCGPAALKIVLDYYNRSYSEKRLVALLGTNQKGTEPQAFLKVAKHLGFKAKSRENMTVVLVKRLIKQGLPVIANHTTPDPTGGHYAVIIGFSQDEFVLSDPAEDSGYIIKKINYFMDNWYEEEDKTVRQGITIGL